MRRWGDESKRVRARIEVIPMIDVMMFLLVFFVLISINVIPAFGLKTRLPVAESAQTNANRHSVVLAIGRDGQLQLDGIPVTTEALVSHLQAIRRQHPEANVVINGDRAVELQRLLEVMDRLKQAGFEAVSIAAQKRPAQ